MAKTPGHAAASDNKKCLTPLQTCVLCGFIAWADYWLYRVFSYIYHDLTQAGPDIKGLSPVWCSLGRWLLYAADLWFLVGFLGLSASVLFALLRDYQKRSNPDGLRWASLHVSSPLYVLLPLHALFTFTIPFGSLRFVVSELHRLVMANDVEADTRTPADKAVLMSELHFYARWAVLILWAVLIGWSGFAGLLRVADKQMRRNAYSSGEEILPL